MNENIKIVDLVKEIAYSLSDEKNIYDIVTNKNNQIDYNETYINFWIPNALSWGYPGICMLYGELDKLFPNESWDKNAYQIVIKMMGNIQKQGLYTSSMYSGAAGIGLALLAVSNNLKRYSNLIGRINDFIIYESTNTLKNIRKRNTLMQDYDVIEGLSGKLSYLYLFKEEEQINQIIKEMLEVLISYTKNKNVFGVSIPRFYINSENHFTKKEKDYYSRGSFNTSLSHGVSGIMSALSLSVMEEINVDGQKDSILKILDFLYDNQIKKDGRTLWKGIISFDEYITKNYVDEDFFVRDAWCYGVPGISLALVYAGIAINDAKVIKDGYKFFSQSLKYAEGLFSPILCHGYAGLLAIAIKMSELSGSNQFIQQASKFFDMIIDNYDEDYIFGFHGREEVHGRLQEVNSIGFLTGSSGVCLTILDYLYGAKTPWKKALML